MENKEQKDRFAAEIKNMEQDDHQTEPFCFDEKTWLEIFNHLDDYSLANVAAVCQQFKALARKVFSSRHFYNDKCISFSAITENSHRWERVMFRFKDIITDVHLVRGSSGYSEKYLRFIEEFLSNSVKSLILAIESEALNKMNFQKTFLKLEHLHICGLTEMKAGHPITRLNQWCPNLNRLILTAKMEKHFFHQSLPSLESVHFRHCVGIDIGGNLWRFFAENNQLKQVSLELLYSTDVALRVGSLLELVNELLINVDTITISATNLDELPYRFYYNFANLKSLSFLMGVGKQGQGTCKDQLLRIVSYMPKIEKLQVINCSENAMTNENLVELIDSSSLTLKNLVFSSKKLDRVLKFGYDLHRQIYGKTGRSDLDIVCEFGCIWSTKLKTFDIKKDGIWEDGKLIVLASRLENH